MFEHSIHSKTYKGIANSNNMELFWYRNMNNENKRLKPKEW